MDPWQTIAVHAVVAVSLLLPSFAGQKSPYTAENDLHPDAIAYSMRPEAVSRPPQPLPEFVPTPAPKPVIKPVVAVKAAPVPQYTGNVADTITRYAQQFGVNASIMLSIAHCESGFRPNAANGPYAGIFQFNSSTWASNRLAMGLSPDPALRNNPEEAAKTAAFKMARDGFGAWPACSRKALAAI
jgi:resuscitation-promoting factor RpfB